MKTELELFISNLTGVFSNAGQFAVDENKTEDRHPLAVHVNMDITDRIKNLPSDFKGIIFLEESYYYYRNGRVQQKPHLFHFFQNEQNKVCLQVYANPEGIPSENLKCENTGMQIEYSTLSVSPTFPCTMIYKKDSKGSFIGKASVESGNFRFTLSESIGKDVMLVSEIAERDGKKLTPYDSPICYRRISDNLIL